MPTHNTTELGLAFSIAAFGMPTGVTALAGVGWIDQLDRHAGQPRLVADVLPQLTEGPIAVPCSSRLPNRRPRADMRQIFERNRTLRVFGFLNKLFCNPMVCVFLEAALFPGQFSQVAFGRKRPALLQAFSHIGIPTAFAFYVSPAISLAI